ncbi:anti-anti-sigma factor [Actinoplanes lutulentus]|uniref:Anti-anti-sigma factor n=1 Tax=Actinoplanes lutulentus TaxID=1287878 RepID=A0A327Z861_9ACTN|nr:STAS domain-containing protein [Actinoplanes lutulentus]MBB2948854.1 anti-anti-sigma factor [Actinoplanes lutulentus]RAK29764.1 anti-anti-sigma factor [Actinoplanes lutulentus]
MTATTVDVGNHPDGTLVIQPHGDLDADDAVDLRRTLVQAIRHTRPLRLVLDLGDVGAVDPINLGTLAAACQLGDDYKVAVFLDSARTDIAARLTAAGVPAHRLRHPAANSA